MGLPIGYSVIVALTGLHIGYGVILASLPSCTTHTEHFQAVQNLMVCH